MEGMGEGGRRRGDGNRVRGEQQRIGRRKGKGEGGEANRAVGENRYELERCERKGKRWGG